MRTHTTIRGLLLAVTLVAALPSLSTAGDRTIECPRYGAQLALAKSALQRGDRSAAVAALRRAKDALRGCEKASNWEPANRAGSETTTG
jgi:hypothetical protein